jgi:hypothetical protein
MHQIWALEFLDLRFERNYYFMQLLHNVLHIKNFCKGNRNSFFIWNFVTFFLFSISGILKQQDFLECNDFLKYFLSNYNAQIKFLSFSTTDLEKKVFR